MLLAKWKQNQWHDTPRNEEPGASKKGSGGSHAEWENVCWI